MTINEEILRDIIIESNRVDYDERVSQKIFEEILQYREIGTVEEFKDLKEKSIPKKPIYSDYDDNGDDKIIPYKAVCPVCENKFEFGYWNDEYNHHCICGQAMNWEQD